LVKHRKEEEPERKKERRSKEVGKKLRRSHCSSRIACGKRLMVVVVANRCAYSVGFCSFFDFPMFMEI